MSEILCSSKKDIFVIQHQLCKEIYYLNKWFDMFRYNGETYLLKFCRHKRRAVLQNIPKSSRTPSPLTRAVRQQQTCTPPLWKCQSFLYWMPAVTGSRCICNSVNMSVRLGKGIKTSEINCRGCLEIHRCLLTLFGCPVLLSSALLLLVN